MSSLIRLNHGIVPLSEIERKLDFQISAYETEALIFCREWMKGQKYFSLNTSGSTGIPKNIVISRQQMILSAMMTQKALKIMKGEKGLACLNINYIAGKMMLVRGMEWEMDLTIVEPSSNPFLATGYAEIDFAALVPFQLHTLLADKKAVDILNKTKHILIGGAPINQELVHSVQQLKCQVHTTFGMTETISHIALRNINGKQQSDFFEALPGVSIGVDDRGCLTVQSDVTKNELVISNDLVEIRDHKHFRWLGRIDNVINTGGLKIAAEQLESMIGELFQQLGLSKRFFICGIKDEHFGEKLVLVIESLPLLSQEIKELENLLLLNLDRFKRPREIIFLDSFLETPSGKLDRIKSKALLAVK